MPEEDSNYEWSKGLLGSDGPTKVTWIGADDHPESLDAAQMGIPNDNFLNLDCQHADLAVQINDFLDFTNPPVYLGHAEGREVKF